MVSSQKIDRNSHEPSYSQLVNIIKKQIASGDLRPGDRLPSESQLCNFHHVSPMTVRRAINILAEQGVVITEQGRGTFVKSMHFWEATFKLGRLKELFLDQRETQVKILEARIEHADARVCEKLALKSGQRCLFIRRLVTLQKEPFLYQKEYLIYDPKRPIIESEMQVTSLMGLFEGTNNSSIKHSVLSIEATTLKPEEAHLLNGQESSAAFLLEHLFFDYNDCPVSWGWFVCPGDRLRFTTMVGIHEKKEG